MTARTRAEGAAILTILMHLDTPDTGPEGQQRLTWLLQRYAYWLGVAGLRDLARLASRDFPVTSEPRAPETHIGRMEGRQVMVTRWPDGAVEVATRQLGGTWGPPTTLERAE